MAGALAPSDLIVGTPRRARVLVAGRVVRSTENEIDLADAFRSVTVRSIGLAVEASDWS